MLRVIGAIVGDHVTRRDLRVCNTRGKSVGRVVLGEKALQHEGIKFKIFGGFTP